MTQVLKPIKLPIQTTEQIEAARTALGVLDPALAVAHAVAKPFEWHIRQSGFVGLVKLIIEQQVSVASAAAIWGRFKEGVGTINSRNVLTYDPDTLKTMGLSRQKAHYVHAIATAEVTGELDFKSLRQLDDESAITELTKLKGVGRWTAEVYLMFCEGRTDLFPAGDLALQEGLRYADRAEERLSEKAIYARAERWRPYRGIAAILLWSYYRGVKKGEFAMPVIKTKAKRKTKKEKPS